MVDPSARECIIVCVKAKIVDIFQDCFKRPLGGRSNHGKTQNDSHAGVQHRQADYGNLSPSRCAGHPSVVKRIFAPIFEAALKGEMQNHLGYASHARTNSGGNARNGYSEKTLKTILSEIPIHVPRDRQGSFEPQIVKKHQRDISPP